MGELKDRFHVGHSPVGHYAFETAEACFEDWQPAASYLIVLMQEYADADDEAAQLAMHQEPLDDEHPVMRAHVDAILRDRPPREGEDYAPAAEDHEGRLIYFWLRRVLCLGDD